MSADDQSRGASEVLSLDKALKRVRRRRDDIARALRALEAEDRALARLSDRVLQQRDKAPARRTR